MASQEQNRVSMSQLIGTVSKKDFPLIPDEAFLYFPSAKEIKEGENKNGLRRIFEGQVEFDEFEKQQLSEFDAYLVKKQFQPSNWWDNSKKLRFLQANGFKFDKTLKTLDFHQQWRQTSIPPMMTDAVEDFLKQGIFYIHGRDHRFRPILVINVKRMDFKQIENWVVLLDLGKIGLSSLPIGELRKMMGYLSSNYRSRMFATYVVNTPSSIFIPYKIVKGFLEEATIRKISFYSDSNPKPLFKHTHISQIEITYSGTAQPMSSQFWPPRVISEQYQIEETKEQIFASKEEYSRKFTEGKLQNNRTLREYIQREEDSNTMNPEIYHQTSLTKIPHSQAIHSEFSLEGYERRHFSDKREVESLKENPQAQVDIFIKELQEGMFTQRKLDEFGEKTPKDQGNSLNIKGNEEELSECSKLIVPQEILPGEISLNRILVKCKSI